MKHILITAVIGWLSLTYSGYAAVSGTTCFGTTTCPNLTGGCAMINPVSVGCKATKILYYNEYGVTSCTECATGYTKQLMTISIPDCSNKASYSDCVRECAGCTDCISTLVWSAAGKAGYEKRVRASCDCDTCIRTTEYRCAAGYYGSSTNGTTGCTPCDKLGGYGTSSAGSLNKTSCYVPANVNITDTAGTFTFTSNCFYTN